MADKIEPVFKFDESVDAMIEREIKELEKKAPGSYSLEQMKMLLEIVKTKKTLIEIMRERKADEMEQKLQDDKDDDETSDEELLEIIKKEPKLNEKKSKKKAKKK